MNLAIFLSLLVSFLLHAVLLYLGPNLHTPLIREAEEKLIEVEMVPREVPIPEALMPKLPLEVSIPKPLDLSRLMRENQTISRPAPSLSARSSLRATGEVPENRPLRKVPQLELPKPVLKIDPARLGAPGKESASRGPRPIPPLRDRGNLEGRKDIPLSPQDERKLLESEISRLETPPKVLLERKVPIRGPAAARHILFRPPEPKMAGLTQSEDIELRFWVLPDGTVGRVVPVRKGSARLEGVATNHLKRWRFSPLPPGIQVLEEWGIVSFRFRVR